jgi:hypothetical protein
MKNILIIALLLSAPVLVKAQDKKPQAQPDSIIKIIPYGDGRYEGYLYTIGGRLQTREDVIIKLMAYAPSAAETVKAKTSLTWSYVSFGGAAIASVASVVDYANNNKHVGETTGIVNGEPGFIYQKHSLAGAYVLTGIATGFLISSFINLANGAKHAKKAIKIYNERFE